MVKLKGTNPYGDDFFADLAGSKTPPSDAPRSVVQRSTEERLRPIKPPSASAISTKPVRLNLDLDADLHRQLRQLALDERTTVAAIVRELIEQRITADSPSAPSL
jgi:hypothetical protein